MGRLRATFILPLKQEVFSGVTLVNSETYFDKLENPLLLENRLKSHLVVDQLPDTPPSEVV